MTKRIITIDQSSLYYYFANSISAFTKLTDSRHTIMITDRNLAKHYADFLSKFHHITVPAGEKYKQPHTITTIIQKLIKLRADRQTLLIGMGGGVITDLTGYTGSIFMRGIETGFIPTSLLGMVDASIGGKNGVDIGLYKNMAGTIRQPSFLFFCPELLATLPEKEWRNGFAEIIKHASILDAGLFKSLEKYQLSDYQNNVSLTTSLVRKNAFLKTSVVKEDEHEKGRRKLLNFGHTLGHAIENLYKLSHGEAISIGMYHAIRISDMIFQTNNTQRLADLLRRYGLPLQINYDRKAVLNLMLADKKKTGSNINYVLLEKIGRGVVVPIPISEIKKLFRHL
jgi:3-dehydroquinate synthase